MEEIQLTKDSDVLICLMYKSYIDKRKSGIPKSKAKHFQSSKEIHTTLTPKWIFEDTDETCKELNRAGLIDIMEADGICYQVTLNDQGIIYMENRFENNANRVLNYISQIKNLLPFI